jgi:hypothetical protein
MFLRRKLSISNNERHTEGKKQGSCRKGEHHEGELKEQNRTDRDRIDRKPDAVVLRPTASPFNKTKRTVAGVSMETSEPQTEDEQIIIFSKRQFFS